MTTKDSGEGKWEEEYREKFTVFNKNGGNLLLRYTDAEKIKSFISSKIEAAYRRGFEDGIREYSREAIKSECKRWMKKALSGMPKHMPPNGFLLTRKPKFGDKEAGFNAALAEVKSIIEKMR